MVQLYYFTSVFESISTSVRFNLPNRKFLVSANITPQSSGSELRKKIGHSAFIENGYVKIFEWRVLEVTFKICKAALLTKCLNIPVSSRRFQFWKKNLIINFENVLTSYLLYQV